MAEQFITVTVDKDIEDMIPTFMKNRVQEVEVLRAALAGGDTAQLGQLGHRMAGVGEPYGFDLVTSLGRRIESSAKAGDLAALEALVAEYADFIARVRVVYQ